MRSKLEIRGDCYLLGRMLFILKALETSMKAKRPNKLIEKIEAITKSSFMMIKVMVQAAERVG